MITTYKTADLESGDPTISVPDSVYVDEHGHAWAVHEGHHDVYYATLAHLEAHYQITIPRASGS